MCAVTLAHPIEQRVTAEGIGHSPRDKRIMTSRYLLKLTDLIVKVSSHDYITKAIDEW